MATENSEIEYEFPVYTQEDYRAIHQVDGVRPEMFELFNKNGYLHSEVKAAVFDPKSWSDSYASCQRYRAKEEDIERYLKEWQHIYRLMYRTALEEIPLVIHDESDSWVALWRLKIGK